MKINFSAISNLKFILILLVIMIHSNFTNFIDCPDEVINSFKNGLSLFSSILLSNAVPAFYMISGFLFYGVKSGSYKDKLARRVKTLLIPYLIWNTLGLLLLIIKKNPLFAEFFPGYQNFHFSIIDIISGYFSLPESIYPYDFTLWFIRNLMIVLCMSPLIGIGIKYLNYWILPVMTVGVVVMMDYFGLNDRFGLSTSFLMFAAGGVIANIRPRKWWIYIASLLYVLAEIIFLCFSITNGLYFSLSIIKYISFGFLCLYVSDYLSSRGFSLPRRLTNSTFFIYAFHGLFATIGCKCVSFLNYPATIWGCVLDYFLCFIVLFTVSYLVYISLNRIMPRILSILCGSRNTI